MKSQRHINVVLIFLMVYWLSPFHVKGTTITLLPESKNHPTEQSSLSGPTPLFFRYILKTNITGLAARVANVGIETTINQHYSIYLPVYYSPYDWGTQYKLRVFAIQPEGRYWFKQVLEGHFVALHTHVGWYNVAMGGDTRYQDNRPLWGAGLSYGYTYVFNRHWGAEFTLGAGYANLSYNEYYNIHNGALTGSNTRNYWGITNVGINLCYRF